MKGGDVASFFEMPAVSACALIHWAFDTSAQLNGYGFPFDLPHLVFYHRLKAVYVLVEAIWETPLKYEKTHKPLHRLFRSIKQVMDDQALRKSATRLNERLGVFDTLRKALRIALPEGKNGLNDDGDDTDMKTILSDTPLVKNLDNEEYLNIILDGCDTLEQRFARIDSNIVVQELNKNNRETGRLPLVLKKMIREPAFPEKLGVLFGC